jgi:hypothetical protein
MNNSHSEANPLESSRRYGVGWNHKEYEELFERKHEAYRQALGAIELFLNARAADHAARNRGDLQPHIERFAQRVAELKQILGQIAALRANDPQNETMKDRRDEGVLAQDWLFNRAGEKEMMLFCSGDSVNLLSDIALLVHGKQMVFDRWHIHYIVRLRFALPPGMFHPFAIALHKSTENDAQSEA